MLDELGRVRHVYVPDEHPLTVYLDKHELVTLMTLGDAFEALILGYLRNQRLISSIEDVASIQADQETESATTSMRTGIVDLGEKTVRHTATTGCGQGTAFDSLTDEVGAVHLPPDTYAVQITLYRVVDITRLQQLIYEQAGFVYGCTLLDVHDQLLHFTEDMGRHNVVDTIAGHMWLEGMEGGDKIFYTTGRLTSEMVVKDAQVDTPSLLSRLGITQMGHQMAQQVDLTLFVRCTGRHSLLYTGQDRFVAESGVAGMVGPHRGLFQAAESGR